MTNTTASAVLDGIKMDNEQLGKLTRRTDELKRRINDGTLEYDWVMDELQQVIEGHKSETPVAAIIAERSQPVLLIPVGTTTVAAEEPIVLSLEVVRERYNIKWYGSNFYTWYRGRTLASFGGSTLAYKKLSHRSFDGPIIAELGGTLPARTELVEILSLVKAQKYGPKSKSGPLLTDGSANISYVEDEIRLPEDEAVAYTNEAGQKVVLRAVDVHWDSGDDGWDVGALAVTNLLAWNGGSRVFSRDSR